MRKRIKEKASSSWEIRNEQGNRLLSMESAIAIVTLCSVRVNKKKKNLIAIKVKNVRKIEIVQGKRMTWKRVKTWPEKGKNMTWKRWKHDHQSVKAWLTNLQRAKAWPTKGKTNCKGYVRLARHAWPAKHDLQRVWKNYILRHKT